MQTLTILQLPLWRLAFGLGYGAITAGAYLWIRETAGGSGIVLFSISCWVLFILLALCFPQKAFNALGSKAASLRGVFFGISQSCLFVAQDSHSTSSAFIAAIAGTLVSWIVGHVILRERVSAANVIGLGLCVVGLFLQTRSTGFSSWGMLGGIFQGFTAIFARSLMTSTVSQYSIALCGFFYAALVSFVSVFFSGRSSELFQITSEKVAISAIIIGVVQCSFLALYRILDIYSASILSLSRVPIAQCLEFFLLRSPPTLQAAIGSIFVLLGALSTLPSKISKKSGVIDDK